VLTRVLTAFFLVSTASATTFNFSGTLTHDDDKIVFLYSVQNQGPVSVATTSFALGGFIPVLSLFDSTGNFLFLDSGYANNTEASLNWVSDAAVDYTVVLTEYDNFPNGLLLTDGFTEDGNGDFTTVLSGFPGPFRDPFGDPLTGDWAVTFSSADPTLAASVPEPGAGVLAGGGMLILALLRRKRAARN
jgi:hypothetical protein